MPKVVVSHTKGLIQESGTGVSFTPDASLTSGIHLYQEVVDIEGVTGAAQDDGVVKYLSKQLPAHGQILYASVEVIEKSNLAAVDLTLSLSAEGAKAEGADITGETDVVAGIAMATGDQLNDVFAASAPVDVAAKVNVALINAGGANTAAAHTSGKVLVSIMVAGSAAPA